VDFLSTHGKSILQIDNNNNKFLMLVCCAQDVSFWSMFPLRRLETMAVVRRIGCVIRKHGGGSLVTREAVIWGSGM
jgi:hypothetical protein